MMEDQSVRQLVADHTRTAHEQLHVHPLFGRLTDPTISLPEYLLALRAFRDVFWAVEAQRCALGVWPDLNILKHCQRLDQDCCGEKRPAYIALSSAASVLGALYAVHGAQFGGSLIRKNIIATLPDAPIAYFSKKNAPAVWRQLTEYMESYACKKSDIAQIKIGANAVFSSIDWTARQLSNLDQLRHIIGPMPYQVNSSSEPLNSA